MTPKEARDALRQALENDQALAAQFEAATSEADFQAVAEQAGVDRAALSSPAEPRAEDAIDLSDTELASMSGGFLYPRTDWFSCEGVKPPWFQ